MERTRDAPLTISPPCCPLLPSEKAETECEALRAELNRVAASVTEREAAMAEGRAQITQLQVVIAEADQVGGWVGGWAGARFTQQ